MRPFLASLTASFFFFQLACNVSGKTEDEHSKAVHIPVLKIEARDTVIEQEYVADIQAAKNVEIRSRIQGFIKEILVDEGQEVTKGQPLFILNDEELQADVSKAKAVLNNATAEAKGAELEMKRIKVLVDKNVISSSEYELAQSRLKSAEARVDEAKSSYTNAQIQLSYTRILSPFSGIIDRIPMKRGSLVDEGTLLTTISDLATIYAYFSVSENEYLRFSRSKKEKNTTDYDNIKLILSDGTAYQHNGRVEAMESEFDSHTGSIAFRATFPNPEKFLKHGASGKIILSAAVEDALIIPQKAVMEIQDKSFVYIVNKDNTVRMKSFSPKTRMDEFIVVQSGLTEHDTIVYEGIQSIKEGTRITPQYLDADQLPALNSGK
ncbi:efflux RND transporter periplasmic adaptor subunit [Pollutibacter soli]|uniref:efflux RND transporter periplasmic adaptor subunit n=1 Tax=Pollutibacter soli TaxID=3034157 RepID=UPI003013F2AC